MRAVAIAWHRGAVRSLEAASTALRGRPFLVDAVTAAALTLMTWGELAASSGRIPAIAAQTAAFTAMTVAVAFRRRAPLGAAAVVGAAMAVQTVLGEAPVVGGFVALLVVLCSAGAHLDGSPSVVALGLLLASASVYPVVEPAARNVPDTLGNLVILAGAWGLGRGLRYHRGRERLLAKAQAELQTRHELDKRTALVAERARIARELHDVVAHGVSLMLLHSGAARLHLDRSPDLAREPLLVVEATGRQALEDLQRMLGVLRLTESSAWDDADLGSGPGLQRLEQLLEHTRAGGLAIELEVEGDIRTVPPALAHCAHRIVQEALTNTVKHAGAARARVRLVAADDRLDVEVRDDGVGRPGRLSLPSGGYGLDGLRERVALYGGQLTAGPLPDGGWRVAAELPHARVTAPAGS